MSTFLVSLVLFLQLVVAPQIHPARLIPALLLLLGAVAVPAAVVILAAEVLAAVVLAAVHPEVAVLAAVHLAAAVLVVPVVVAFLAAAAVLVAQVVVAFLAAAVALLPLAMAHLLDSSLDIPMSLGGTFTPLLSSLHPPMYRLPKFLNGMGPKPRGAPICPSGLPS
jgi:hypothetical protein